VRLLELSQERFLLVTIAGTQHALKLGDVDRVIRRSSLVDWRGGGSVQAYTMVEGYLVWIVEPAQLFAGFDRLLGRPPNWLIMLKDSEGLTRLGFLADDVRGPIAYARLGQVRVLNRLGMQTDDAR
jgi:hypothetical protein